MTCQCDGIEYFFSKRLAESELRHYQRKGPDKTTKMLIDAVSVEGVEGKTLLDIGGGIGAVQHALLKAGAGSAVDVDGSLAYIDAARGESERQGLAGKVTYCHIVTLDRVVCCYDDMTALVGASAEHAKSLYALVYPRDTPGARLVAAAAKAGHLVQPVVGPSATRNRAPSVS